MTDFGLLESGDLYAFPKFFKKIKDRTRMGLGSQSHED